MRISTKEIMMLGNPQHQDFGLFAKFITGMGEYVYLPSTQYPCDVCFNVGTIVLDEKDPHNSKKICMWCRGHKKGLEENNTTVVVERAVAGIKEHRHTFAKGNDKSRRCKLCGLYESMQVSI